MYIRLDMVHKYLGPFVDLNMVAWMLRKRLQGDGGWDSSTRPFSYPVRFF